MSFLIKAMGFPDGTECPHEGMYLKSFDFEYADGQGFGEFTKDPKLAMKFGSTVSALNFWKTQSNIRPLRLDGKPNRPLTALSILLEKYEGGDDEHLDHWGDG